MWMPIRRLKRDEPGVDVVALQAMLQAAVGLAGRDRQQPAVVLERVEQLQHAIEQWLLYLPGLAQTHESALVVLS